MSLDKAKRKPLKLTAEQMEADEVLAAAAARVAEKQASEKTRARNKRTPANKTRHAVDNDVHAANASSRQMDSRSEIHRESEKPTTWQRASSLRAPTPRPGMKQKWVRYRGGKEEDTDNLDRYLEEGWQPRKTESVRKGHELTADLKSKYAGYIVKRGLILMEIPEAMAAQRNRNYGRKAERMTEGIDRNMFKIDHRSMYFLDPKRRTHVSKTANRGRLEDRMAGDE